MGDGGWGMGSVLTMSFFAWLYPFPDFLCCVAADVEHHKESCEAALLFAIGSEQLLSRGGTWNRQKVDPASVQNRGSET